MIKTLLSYVKQYKKPTIVSMILVIGEAGMDVVLPFIISMIIDKGISSGNMKNILLYGGIMVLAAILAFLFGMTGGRMNAYASTGFASNLREAMFGKIQDYSFANIDRFSSAGLITRLTTDVTNIQRAFQMVTRMCLRAQLMLIMAFIMSVTISPKLSTIFLAAIVLIELIIPLYCEAFLIY